jgi:Pentapeptide repeats (8 copies)
VSGLAADCSRCVGLCCAAPAFVRSADFAFSKPAGVACRHLSPSARCGIHAELLTAGMRGCVAYDCFGAGQRVVALLGPARTPAALQAYDVVRQLHELLWYVTDALARPAAAPLHAQLAAARSRIEGLVAAIADAPPPDPTAERATVAPLLRHASTLIRAIPRAPTHPAAQHPAAQHPAAQHPAARDLAGRDLAGRDLAGRDLAGRDLAGRDLAGRDLAGRDLRGVDLSTALLVGANLRGADLREADLLAADLRGADLTDADLTDALYLSRTQIGGARGSTSTRLPARLPHPTHWHRD